MAFAFYLVALVAKAILALAAARVI